MQSFEIKLIVYDYRKNSASSVFNNKALKLPPIYKSLFFKIKKEE